jgi:hypothetical protein
VGSKTARGRAWRRSPAALVSLLLAVVAVSGAAATGGPVSAAERGASVAYNDVAPSVVLTAGAAARMVAAGRVETRSLGRPGSQLLLLLAGVCALLIGLRRRHVCSLPPGSRSTMAAGHFSSSIRGRAPPRGFA